MGFLSFVITGDADSRISTSRKGAEERKGGMFPGSRVCVDGRAANFKIDRAAVKTLSGALIKPDAVHLGCPDDGEH